MWPLDGSPPGSPIPRILQERTLEWVAISFSNAWKWKVKVKLLSRVRLFATPRTVPFQAPPSMGFSRQEYWSGLPLPSLSSYHKCLQIPFQPPPSLPSQANTDTASAGNSCLLTSSLLSQFLLLPIASQHLGDKPTSMFTSKFHWSLHKIVKPIIWISTLLTRWQQSEKITCFGIRHTWAHSYMPPPISYASQGLLLKLGSSIASLSIHTSIHSKNQ